MAVPVGVCPACRLRIWGRLQIFVSQPLTRHISTIRAPDAVSTKSPIQVNAWNRPSCLTQLVCPRSISYTSPRTDAHVAKGDGQVQQASDYHEQLSSDQTEDDALEKIRDELDPADVARAARERFRDRLPQGALRAEEYKAYERLYGTPQIWTEEHDLLQEEIDANAQEDARVQEESQEQLQQHEPWEKVEDFADADEEDLALPAGVDDMRLQADIKTAMTTDADAEWQEKATEYAQEDEGSRPRTHPFTTAGRFGTDPTSLSLPAASLALPTAAMLADTNNKHLDQTAERLLGGKGLPYGPGNPQSSRSKPQMPIPLTAKQGRMSPLEADVWMAALGPGVYASVMSVVVELRRRLGSAWLESLLLKPDGPKILDAGSGGVGVLAWREMVRAEWARMRDDPMSPAHRVHASRLAPIGKATVLTASDSLRLRASALLEDTTFLPRLPDYVHVADKTSEQRKQFDIVLAPHTLWDIKEEKLRRQHIENLWSLTSARGGVLVILEKGVPRGFEVVADARQYLLRSLFAPTSDQAEIQDPRRIHPGAIVAPCTNHKACPMYPVPGVSEKRKDFCHFTQRYIRPNYYQRLLGAKNRNFEDVPYSYVAVRKGHQQVYESNAESKLSGEAATLRAFEGYEIGDEDLLKRPNQSAETTVSVQDETESYQRPDEPQPSSQTKTGLDFASLYPDPQTLPRIILSPLKRRGHVVMDVCTPSGTMERWTVTRSFGKQAYHDARKSGWGDLWALGAKFRLPRSLRLGENGVGADVDKLKDGKSKQPRGRLKARMRKREEMKNLAAEKMQLNFE